MENNKAGSLWSYLAISDKRGKELQKIGDKIIHEFLSAEQSVKTSDLILRINQETRDLLELERTAVCFVVTKTLVKVWIPYEILDS
mgnify:CR=1 FL=1